MFSYLSSTANTIGNLSKQKNIKKNSTYRFLILKLTFSIAFSFSSYNDLFYSLTLTSYMSKTSLSIKKL